jgi:hypothetical protein
MLSVGASSASADRTFDSSITQFNGATSVGFEANGNVWISDHGQLNKPPSQEGVYQYNPYPSQTLLDAPDTLIDGSLGIQLAVDQSNGEIFVAQYNGRNVHILAPNSASHPCPEAEPYCYSRAWDHINGVFSFDPGIHVAVDNSNSYSRGRVYLSLYQPEDAVEALDPAKRPIDFPATASYISDNKLTGTPSSSFGDVQNITVDSSGNIYVTDTYYGVVDEFDSTGTFVRTFPAPQASDGNPGTGGVGVDPTNGNVLITGGSVAEFDSSGNHLGTLTGLSSVGTPAVNSNGYLYVPDNSGPINIFTPNQVLANVTYKPVSSPTTTSGTVNANVDPNGGGDITACHFEYGTDTSYGTSATCSPDPSGTNFSAPTDVSAAISGLSADTTYHYRVVVISANGTKYGTDQTYITGKVPGLSTDPATNLTESSATLNASFVGDGSPTNYYFEWGPTKAYGNQTATPPGDGAGSPSAPARTPLSTDLSGLAPYSTYHYRVVATNGTGTTDGEDRMFTTTPGAPSAKGAAVTAVHSDRALFHGQVNPNGADATVHFEYVDDATFQQSGWANATLTSPNVAIGMSKHYQSASTPVDGLTPGTLYHIRVVGTNQIGSGSAAATFRTFAFTPSFVDPCPNAHVRQQTGAALLLDCRAYELASAANAGGYDVESDLVAGQTPFGGYPNAENPSQVLYGVHNGGIPGTGNPTNNGVDPYVATRGADGWTTKYVGIPANNPNANGPFASTLAEADPSLGTLAFGGPKICSPCFADGTTGTPIHLPDGNLVQGMAGSIDPGPTAEPEGFIGRHLSADGSHFVFGSSSQFEPDGNSGGDVSIYDRNLKTGLTHVVSKTTGGSTMTGAGIGELDISADGSRIVVGQLISTDAQGNRYWHLYMNVGDSGQSIDLTPGTTTGALYDGMSADGTKVYFTSADKLTGDDTDTSADIYRADVTNSDATLTRVSTGTGGSGDTDSCNPAANTIRTHWNTVGPDPNCDAVAVGGGGGVASGDGTIYFLSPELLDGGSNGVQDAPNLYIARPGDAPHFIRTLESSANAPLPPAAHPYLRSFGSFLNAAGTAIDHQTGDVYLFDISQDIGSGYIYKFDSAGHTVTSFASSGKLTISGAIGFYGVPVGIAVDNDPTSPNYGDLYVPDLLDGLVKQYGPQGAHLADISGLGFPTGVGVDPANGNVYVTNLFAGVSVFDTNGSLVTSFSTIASPTDVAVDSSGNAYVTNGNPGGFTGAKGTTEKYSSTGTDLGQLDGNPSNAVAVDPSDDHVYVDEGNRVVEFDSAGTPVGTPTGSDRISNSIGVAADSGNLAISDRSHANVAYYGPAVTPPDPSTDNPVVVDSVSAAGTRNTADFEASPSGNDAVFTSTLPLTGYDNAAHREVFRYNAPTDTLDCASCNPTGEQATGEATMASNGSSLSDDGRVFFNSTEGLVDRDLNSRMDAYEWEKGAGAQEGTIELISTGTSPLDSGLLGTSADGTDAYFFTRDTLVSGDYNGNRVKIYDARANGGFPQVPSAIQCQASDECHGPSSQAPRPPNIKTIASTPVGNATQTPRRRKHHHKRRRRHHHHHHHHHHKRAHHKRGGAK